MSLPPIFEAKKGVRKAGNTVLTLNQPVTGSSPVRLTIWIQIACHYFIKRSVCNLLAWLDLFEAGVLAPDMIDI